MTKLEMDREDWIQAYRTAFVDIATQRGWALANAESWLDSVLPDQAYEDLAPNRTLPREAALLDIKVLEMEEV